MSHTIKDLENQISKGAIHPVYLLLGEEAFLQKESLKLITRKIISVPEYKDFNYDVFYAKETTARRLQEAIETLPVFCSQRLVVCFDAHLFKEKDWESLLSLFKNPSKSCVVVLTAPELDKRKKLSKKIMEYSFVVENKSPARKDLGLWVRKLTASYDLNFSPSAVQLIIHWAGPSIMSMDNEIKKIKSFAGSRSDITEEDVIQVVSRIRPENVFSFTEAIGKKDLKKSFHFLIHLLEDQESESGIIALVARHIRILSQIKEGLKEGLRSSELSSKAGVPVFFLKDYIQQVRIWEDKDIMRVTKILHDTDRALKSSPVSSDIWMENFVLKACT